jgi:hypothetical protein
MDAEPRDAFADESSLVRPHEMQQGQAYCLASFIHLVRSGSHRASLCEQRVPEAGTVRKPRGRGHV